MVGKRSFHFCLGLRLKGFSIGLCFFLGGESLSFYSVAPCFVCFGCSFLTMALGGFNDFTEVRWKKAASVKLVRSGSSPVDEPC